MIDERILTSYDNTKSIIMAVYNDLKTKIKNKDISLPYSTQLSKSSYLKIDGNGNLFLNNGGKYIDLGNIDKDKLDIDKIYKIFNIVNQKEQWDTTPYTNMPTARLNFGCVEYNGKIYCIGGYGNTGYLNKVEVYDILSNTWSTNNNMPTSRNAFGCIEYNGKIYCIGGNNSSNINKVEVYNISSNTWSTNYSPMPTDRRYFRCIEYNGKIYCIGGYTTMSINKVEVYQLAYSTYNINLPSDIANKLSLLINNGTGNKLLTDNGTYQEYIPSGYREMNSDEMNLLATDIKSVLSE